MYSTELSSDCTCELPEFPYPSLWTVSQCIRVGKATSAGRPIPPSLGACLGLLLAASLCSDYRSSASILTLTAIRHHVLGTITTDKMMDVTVTIK